MKICIENKTQLSQLSMNELMKATSCMADKDITEKEMIVSYFVSRP